MGSATFLVALLCGVSLAYPGGTVGIERADLGGHLVPNATDNCTESSQFPSYWRIENFVLKVYNWESGGSTGTFGFKSYFSATNATVECQVQDVDLAKLADGPWSGCKSTGSEFRFNLEDISLTMKETWTCSGSPGRIFNANATGRIMLHGCLDSETVKGVESDCDLMGLEMSANATSSAIT